MKDFEGPSLNKWSNEESRIRKKNIYKILNKSLYTPSGIKKENVRCGTS